MTDILWGWHEECIEPDYWWKRAGDEADVGTTVPMSVETWRRWTVGEIAERLADMVAESVPEWAYEDDEMSHRNWCSPDDWPPMNSAERTLLLSALTPYAADCNPTCMVRVGTEALTPDDWRTNAGVLVDSHGTVLGCTPETRQQRHRGWRPRAHDGAPLSAGDVDRDRQ